jgi:prepilin-type processing-associated H-X9-DG protein
MNKSADQDTGGSPSALETLVVIVVLGILLFMIFPAMSSGREKGRRANCLSNLKQIGQAIAVYAGDYSGRCPADAVGATLIGSLSMLSNKLSSAKCLRCPSDWRLYPGSWQLQTQLWTNDFKALTAGNTSYAYVPNLMWDSESPRKIVALDRITSAASGSTWPTNGNHKTSTDYGLFKREHTGGNILFTDGRVEWHTSLPSALTDKNGREIVLSP